jgi:(R)-2-hydroxyacyl-CoA dehydratese activating ATPase
MIFAGIDAGSRAIKIVLLKDGSLLAAAHAPQGPQPGPSTDRLYEQTLAEQGLSGDDVAFAVATGYARSAVTRANTTITEITCHAAGVHNLSPDARTVIEIGGQDSKLLRLDGGGAVRDFAMNDRCAAGTGRFLEMVADKLSCSLADLGPLARGSRQPAVISSMCAVFAETEIIGLLASGCRAEDVVAGVQHAIASRIVAMAGGDVQAPVVFTGGVARIDGMADAMRTALGKPVAVCPKPEFTGALGAALLASRKA